MISTNIDKAISSTNTSSNNKKNIHGDKQEYLILVDKNDNPIGIEEKVKCHLLQGKLHRAFTAILFDHLGNLILTRRSPNKMLWPGDWDGTVASHPRESETYASSATRRLPEEIGLSCNDLDYLFKFEYHVPYKNIGSENEICGTLIGVIGADTKFNLIKTEIDALKMITPDDLTNDLLNNPQIYCPWMLIALYFLPESQNKNILQTKYGEILDAWVRPQIRDSLKKSIKKHIPNDSNWRLVPN